MPSTACLQIWNQRSVERRVMIEPWALSWILLSDQKITIVAVGAPDVSPWFCTVESDGVTQVFLEDAADYRVYEGEFPENNTAGALDP